MVYTDNQKNANIVKTLEKQIRWELKVITKSERTYNTNTKLIIIFVKNLTTSSNLHSIKSLLFLGKFLIDKRVFGFV